MSKYGNISCHYCPSRRGMQVVYDKEGKIGVRLVCKRHRAKAHKELQEMIDDAKGV